MKTGLGTEYLHAEDLILKGIWTERKAVIADVLEPNTVKSADGKLIDKHIICFSTKRLVVGNTNKRLIKYAIGTANEAEWKGRAITLYAARGNWFGQKNVAAIRIRIPDGQAKPFMQPKNLGEDLTGKSVSIEA